MVNHEGVQGYTELSKSERATFFAEASDLFDADLRKKLNEVITKSRMDRQISAFKRSGKAMEFTEAEKKFKDKPDEWASILRNAPRFKCVVRGIDMIVADPE